MILHEVRFVLHELLLQFARNFVAVCGKLVRFAHDIRFVLHTKYYCVSNGNESAPWSPRGATAGETGGGNGVLRALKRLLLKRRAGLESHLRDLANASVELGEDGTTIRCRKVTLGRSDPNFNNLMI